MLFQTLQQELQQAATEFQLFHLHHIMLVRSHYKVLRWCYAIMDGQWEIPRVRGGCDKYEHFLR